MLITNIIGFTAAIVGTSLMVPQVVKSYRTKSVKDVALGMIFLYFLNCFLWFLYGVLILAWPIIICNFIATIVSVFQLSLKIKYN